MGRNNVLIHFYESATVLIPPHRRLAREIFIAMCLYAYDYPEADPPVYYGGLERIARAVGYSLPLTAASNLDQLRGSRQTIMRRIQRELRYLRELGLLVQARRTKPHRMNQHYAIVLDPEAEFAYLAGAWDPESGQYDWQRVPRVWEEGPKLPAPRTT